MYANYPAKTAWLIHADPAIRQDTANEILKNGATWEKVRELKGAMWKLQRRSPFKQVHTQQVHQLLVS